MIHLHSILRYAVLALMIFTVIKSVTGWLNKNAYTTGDAKLALIQMIFVQIQFVLGLVLYFTEGWAAAPFKESMADAGARFWKIEHITGMIIAVALVEIGRIRTKKIDDDIKKHRNAAIFYGIALLIILNMIPWGSTKFY